MVRWDLPVLSWAGDAGRVQGFIFLFLMSIKRTKGRGGFKLPFLVKTSYSYGYSVRNIRAVIP